VSMILSKIGSTVLIEWIRSLHSRRSIIFPEFRYRKTIVSVLPFPCIDMTILPSLPGFSALYNPICCPCTYNGTCFVSDAVAKTLRRQKPLSNECLQLKTPSIRLDPPDRRPCTPHPLLQPAPPGLQQMSQPLPPRLCRLEAGPWSSLGREKSKLMRCAWTYQ